MYFLNGILNHFFKKFLFQIIFEIHFLIEVTLVVLHNIVRREVLSVCWRDLTELI